ncbi:glycosyltransferase family 9 protein, partial [uncultured Fusobacterium sp.]
MKILVVRFKQIGDAVLSSAICNTLKKSFPESEIDYV